MFVYFVFVYNNNKVKCITSTLSNEESLQSTSRVLIVAIAEFNQNQITSLTAVTVYITNRITNWSAA